MGMRTAFLNIALLLAIILCCGCFTTSPSPQGQTETTPAATVSPESSVPTPTDTLEEPTATVTPAASQAPIRQGGSSSRRSSSTSPTVPVIASFTANVTSGTAPLGVAFTDTSTGAPTAWTWNATNVTGNNIPYTFSTEQNPAETFGIGNYSIVLTASKATGSDTSDPLWINVTSPCRGTIGDIVWNDLDHDGFFDAGEPGLAGITVELVDPDSNTVLQSMSTDLNGKYQFDALCAGTYEVRVNSTTLPSGFVPTVSVMINLTTVSASSPATVILSTDASSILTIDFGYYEQISVITIETRTNGEDADTPPGPSVSVGSSLTWTYEVSNAGDVVLSGVTVTDDRGVAVSCPKNVLQPGESMTCTASGSAIAGQYTNIGTVTGTPPVGPPVTASDPSHYFGVSPSIQFEMLTNGEDADTPPGPLVLAGSSVIWTYVVTNTGDVGLNNVAVTDDQGATVTCPKTVLEPGEAMTCSASGTAVAGQYANVGTVTGTPPDGTPVTASDPSHYFGAAPSIDIEKYVSVDNGTTWQDADTAPGPNLSIGVNPQFRFVVTNTGNVALANVDVTDSVYGTIALDGTLAVGASAQYLVIGTWATGQHTNTATATGDYGTTTVTDNDAANYLGT
jgi:PKD repeat protein